MISVVRTILAIFVALPITAMCYEVANHADMARFAVSHADLVTDPAALARLGLHDLTQEFPTSAGPDSPDFINGCRRGRTYSVPLLIECGAQFEDAPDLRVLNHFFDPTRTANDGALGVAGTGLLTLYSSPQWALAARGTVDMRVANTGFVLDSQENSYIDARQYLFDALTKTGISASERDSLWGKTFQSIGQVIHHLQDMAQPQHVRNDSHCKFEGCALAGKFAPSSYERYTLTDEVRRSPSMGTLLSSGAAVYPVYRSKLAAPRSFWVSSGAGIAEYTNSNFVSQGTLFRMVGGIAQPSIAYPFISCGTRTVCGVSTPCDQEGATSDASHSMRLGGFPCSLPFCMCRRLLGKANHCNGRGCRHVGAAGRSQRHRPMDHGKRSRARSG